MKNADDVESDGDNGDDDDDEEDNDDRGQERLTTTVAVAMVITLIRMTKQDTDKRLQKMVNKKLMTYLSVHPPSQFTTTHTQYEETNMYPVLCCKY